MIKRTLLALALSLATIVGAHAQGVTVQGLPEATLPLRASGGASQDVFWCGQGSVTRKCYLTDILSALPSITAKISVPAGAFYGGPSAGPGVPSFRTLTGSDIPAPTAITLGGVFSNAGAAHRYISAILTSGAVTLSQPSVADLAEGSTGSSTVVRSYAPTITGGLTVTGGAVVSGGSTLTGGATINGGLTLGTALTVPNGGTGLTSGTSGGVPYYSASTTIASSGALTANALVLGGGAGAAPAVSTGITSNGGSAVALGVSSTTTGQLLLRGATSGGVTISAQSAAGSGNILAPNAGGTMAVSATAPLTVSATTGNITTSAAANTIHANATSGTAAMTAFVMPSCADTAGNHLNYVNGTGITCGTSSVVGGSPITNSLSGNVSLNNISNYFDGPSVAQGSTGTWFASGTVTLTADLGTNAGFLCKLWDGTTVIASGAQFATATTNVSLALSGYITSPAGNIRISCRDPSGTAGLIVFNLTGNSKDSTVSAFRLN